jgi:hypothetical protein
MKIYIFFLFHISTNNQRILMQHNLQYIYIMLHDKQIQDKTSVLSLIIFGTYRHFPCQKRLSKRLYDMVLKLISVCMDYSFQYILEIYDENGYTYMRKFI